MSEDPSLAQVLAQARACTLCREHLPLGPRPVLVAEAGARLLIIGQAPGTRVHATGIPWNDPSGDRLRGWLGMSRERFYDARQVAIVPMGFCYPGRGRGGDLPPRTECAPLWHGPIRARLPHIALTLLVGQHAQRYYLDRRHANLTERVRGWRDYGPDVFPLVHPSGRNQHWFKRHPWFAEDVLPGLRARIAALGLADPA